MKVWVKLLIGSVLGLLLGFFLPGDNEAVSGIFSFLVEIAIGMGRYTAVALILFSLIIGIYELRQDGEFWKLVLKTIAGIAATAVFVITAGIIITAVFPPGRIPVLTEQSAEKFSLEAERCFIEMFPSNMLSAITGNGGYLFPVGVFALFTAIGLSYDKNYTKQIISIVDSLSRIFYNITALFSEILGFMIIILSAYWAIRYQSVIQTGVFNGIIYFLLIFALVFAFIIMPAALYFVNKYKTPWKTVYASVNAAIAAFFSGDINFSVPVFTHQTKENLGVRRRANTVTTLLWTTFGRSGSAMVAVISFVVIVKSYSSLNIEAGMLINIGLNAFLISFLLGRNPGDGAFAVLAVLCSRYGHDFETGYLILKPISFYLISVGTFLDIMFASFGCFTIARISGFQIERETKRFI
jgi:Na+/H+-dicarboxylate symporter